MAPAAVMVTFCATAKDPNARALTELFKLILPLPLPFKPDTLLAAVVKSAVPPEARLTVNPGAPAAVITPAAVCVIPPAPAVRFTPPPLDVTAADSVTTPLAAAKVLVPTPASAPPAFLETLAAVEVKEVAPPPV